MRLTNKILKSLEKYLLKKNNFQLTGENYDLILLTPMDKYQADTKYALLISAKRFDKLQQKEAIRDLLTFFKEDLETDEYNAISRLNVIHSEDRLVKNLNLLSTFVKKCLR